EPVDLRGEPGDADRVGDVQLDRHDATVRGHAVEREVAGVDPLGAAVEQARDVRRADPAVGAGDEGCRASELHLSLGTITPLRSRFSADASSASLISSSVYRLVTIASGSTQPSSIIRMKRGRSCRIRTLPFWALRIARLLAATSTCGNDTVWSPRSMLVR